MSVKTSQKQLSFHDICGSNIVLKNNKTLAFRKERVDQSFVFTHRPVKIFERIVFQIKKTTNLIACGLIIGFISKDPSTIDVKILDRSPISRKNGMWTKLLPKSINKNNYVISFYVDDGGCVYYSVNNGNKKFLFKGVYASLTLWAIIHVFGIVSEIKLLGSGFSLLDIEKKLIDKAKSQKVLFHKIHSENVFLTNDRNIASKSQDADCYACVFSNRPLEFDAKVIVGVKTHCSDFKGMLEYGVTSTDPSKISPNGLPVNNVNFPDFCDTFVIYHDKNYYKSGDIIVFVITSKGNFMAVKNCTTQVCCLPVNNRKPLWLYLKLSECISEISIMRPSTEGYCKILAKHLFKDVSVSSNYQKLEYCTDSTLVKEGISLNPCIICIDKPANAIFHRCGHMCMCYECAYDSWQCDILTRKIIICPMCNSSIYDVIKAT